MGMKVKMFAVRDAKAEAFLQPMFFQSKGLAVRAFADAANDVGHNFCKHAEDFTLFELGEWDDESGVFTQLPQPLAIGSAFEFLRVK